MSISRLLTLCVAGMLLVLTGSCGGDASSGPLLFVEVLPADGTVPAALTVIGLTSEGEESGRYEALRVAEDRPGEFRVPGAPDGYFHVEAGEGWHLLPTGGRPPRLAAAGPPARARLGRPHTLYVVSDTRGLVPGTRWGATRTDSMGHTTPVDVRVEEPAPGYERVAVLRFVAEAWAGELRVVGYFVREGIRAPQAGGAPGVLSDPVVFQAPDDLAPKVAVVGPAPVSPLDVLLVPGAEGIDVDRETVHVAVRGLPVEAVWSECVRRGTASFDALPTLGRELYVHLESASREAVLLDHPTWQRQADLRLLVLPRAAHPPVEATLPASATGAGPETPLPTRTPTRIQVQVLPPGAASFARVPHEREGRLLRFDAPEGPFDLLLRVGDRWALVPREDRSAFELRDADLHEGVRVEGTAQGAAASAVVRFVLRRGDRSVVADGFVLRVGSGGRYETLLPVGTYGVQVASNLGVSSRPAPLVLDEPGASVHLPLTGPGR